ncbi:polypeptide N-acetylgalactosaminyltransferase 3-like [Planococcus citri]|uniref:polypeptide N-acetylgalactosaminyltransferase 3-like n=1 Tax=Planococcus citri TaxID=170843 RepID=UPI0031F765A2
MCLVSLHRKFRRKLCILLSLLLFVFSFITLDTIWQHFHEIPNSSQYKNHLRNQHSSLKDIHVIVGHYLGENDGDGLQSTNLTDEFLNTNKFDPKPKEGENGRAVIIPSYLSARMRQLFRINRFNLMASDRIPLNRSLPDVRKKKCLKNVYEIKPDETVSVIIVFYNEAWSTLLRTVTSVINRSPRHLLKEIILVDDASNRDFLKQPLDDYVSKLSTVTYVIHSNERKGLIRSRLLGARQAKGSILVFLDAHCECTVGWLESLVHHVSSNKTRVACPVIDIISDETFAYIRSFEKHLGAFNWDLHFRWYATDRHMDNPVQPFKTPVMAGGLFAINKEYFFEIGAYDDQMEIWGGENLELSFRIWQCGGSIDIVPCSHVGHIFRKSSPYVFPGGVSKVLYSNLIRVALVWMDDWGEFYLKFHPETKLIKNELDVRERKELRRKMQCNNFEWYLENVWNQRFMPMKNRIFGKIRHSVSGLCLEKPTGKSFHNQPTGVASVSECSSNLDLFQMFVLARYESQNNSVSIATDESVCLDVVREANADKLKVFFSACTNSNKQKWIYNVDELFIKHQSTNLCVEVAPNERYLILSNCTRNVNQKWNLQLIPWK